MKIKTNMHEKMNEKTIMIYKPRNAHRLYQYCHKGDTFREMIDMWEERGYVKVQEIDGQTPESGLVWYYDETMENDKIVLLYDRPNLTWLPDNISYTLGLFANSPTNSPTNFPANNINVPWIFWARNPRMLHDFINELIKSYDQRTIKSIFIGNIENSVQDKFRSDKFPSDDQNERWQDVIEYFSLVKSHNHVHSPMDYLQLLSKSRYGLALRGFGPKCNREIELMALGVVPLITDLVSVQYYDPIIEGLHYFRVSKPEDVHAIVEKTPKWRWEQMSMACRRWYERNASPEGSFRTTKRIIDINLSHSLNRNERNEDLKNQKISISTMATEMAWKDLQLMLFSLYQFHPTDVHVFIACDDFIAEQLPQFIYVYVPKLQYTTTNVLEQYAAMDRKTMEQWGLWLDFMLRKCDAINLSFQHGYESTLFVDCDMVFMNHINMADFELHKNVGRSPHFIKEENEKQFGKYNGGFLWVNHQGFADWWTYASHTPSSRYYEQAILEEADKYFTVFDVPIQYNYGWWRLYECHMGLVAHRESLFRVVPSHHKTMDQKITNHPMTNHPMTNHPMTIMYEGKPLRTIHTHFGEKTFPHTVRFNQFMMKLMVASKQTKLLEFIKMLFYSNNQNDIKEISSIKVIQKEFNSEEVKMTESNVSEFQRNETEGPKSERANVNENELQMNETEGPRSEEPKYEEPTEIHMVVQYYNDVNPERQDEIDYCFQANLMNPHVVKLHNMCELNTRVPEWLKTNPKYVEYSVSEWLDYKTVFEYANEKMEPGTMVCLCNADIFLDHTSKWREAKQMLEYSLVFCQSRYEFDGEQGAKKDEALQRIAYANAQDAWLFKTPFHVRDCGFKMGKLGSDNAIADRIKNSGYVPVNSPNQFKIYHYDVCRGKTGKNYLQVQKPNLEHPEHRGYYLLPDIDAIKSVDALIEVLGLGSIHKYRAICDIMSRYIEIKNP